MERLFFADGEETAILKDGFLGGDRQETVGHFSCGEWPWLSASRKPGLSGLPSQENEFYQQVQGA